MVNVTEMKPPPLLQCDERAARIAFWLLYPILVVLLFAVLMRATGWGA